MRIDEAGHDGLAGDADRARPGWDVERAAFADRGDAVVGDEHIALRDHLVALHGDDPRAGQQHRAFRARARELDGDVGLLRLRRISLLPEELRAQRPGHGFAVVGPLDVIAAFERHWFYRQTGFAPALDAHFHRFASGTRCGDDEVFALEADECARAIRRHANVIRTRRVVAGADAGDTEQRPAVMAIHGDGLEA